MDYFGYKTVFGLAVPTIGMAAIEVVASDETKHMIHEAVFGPKVGVHTRGYSKLPKWLLLGHMIGGSMYLLSYLHQFQRIAGDKSLFAEDKATRTRHKRIGYLGFAAGATVAATGLVWAKYFAPAESGGIYEYMPMAVSALGWLVCSMKAYHAIAYERDEEKHMRWVVRSYAAQFGVPSRLTGILFFNLLGMDVQSAWGHVLYTGMLLHIVGAECVLQHLKKKKEKKKMQAIAMEV